MTAAGDRAPRPCRSTHQWTRRRVERYAVLRDVARLSSAEAKDACIGPIRFCDAMRSRGINPMQWPELAIKKLGGWPRRPERMYQVRTARYHELRQLGASAAFASVYSKGEFVFAKGKRILKGLEEE